VLTTLAYIVAAFALSQGKLPAGATEVLPKDALFSVPVGGLERTEARAETVASSGTPFTKLLRVTLPKGNVETNATQLTVPNAQPIQAGDVLLASFWVRGASLDGKLPAATEFMFERSTSPWTKSVTRSATAARVTTRWRHILVPFRSAETYAPGEAMASIRMALQPQKVELGGLSILNYRNSRTLDDLVAASTELNRIGDVRATLSFGQTAQTMRGLGGNFCQPRYGQTTTLDSVGEYVVQNLKVSHARVGLPLEKWNPEPGVFKDDAQSVASLRALQEFSRSKLPTMVSVWEGPEWMVGGAREQSGKVLPREKYKDCIDAIARYLVLARDKYETEVDYVSFNEPDLGINFKFSSAEMGAFIRQAGPEFERWGLETKFLVGDTANGTNFFAYAEPLLKDSQIAPYLGPLAFHSWDALSASESAYRAIAELGKKYNKPVWCTEAGHDAQLWQTKDPWGTWENALRLALSYERTVRLTGSETMMYWTYEDNYTLVDGKNQKPYAAFNVIQQMERVFANGAKIIGANTDSEELKVIASQGPGAGRWSALLVNPAGPGTVSLRGLPTSARVSIRTLTATGTKMLTLRSDPKGVLRVTVPGRSVIVATNG
jgi:hypothetical protein